MPKPISFGKIDVSLTSDMGEAKGVPEEETPFRIAVLGDFSGRASRGVFNSILTGRKPLLVDRDNLEDVLARLHAELRLPILGKEAAPVVVRFSEMDDFHPDALYEKLDVFEALRAMRQGVKDPGMFASLVREETALPQTREPQKEEAPEGGGLLDRILDASESGAAEDRPPAGSPEMDRFLREITAPHLVPKADPRQAQMLASVDEAAGELMRRILHHPDFQALESLWRGVFFLARRLETDENLKIYLFDLSKEELAADLSAEEDLSRSSLYKSLVGETVKAFGGEPWAVLAGHYRFGADIGDIELLGRLAKIAAAAGSPFIASALDAVLGCESLAKTPDPDDWKEADGSRAWDALRKIPEAAYLGLALPGFLLRLPYGPDTEPLERFPFQEMAGPPVHGHYLWGNPSIVCAFLLAQSFLEEGWALQPGRVMEIEDLPLYVYKEEGESVAKPCAEVLLTEEAAERILDKGLLLLLSYRNRDMIRLARFQSLADPPANLAGRWG